MGASGGMLLLLPAVGVGCYGPVDGFLREDVGDTLVVAVTTTASAVKMLVYVYSKWDVGESEKEIDIGEHTSQT